MSVIKVLNFCISFLIFIIREKDVLVNYFTNLSRFSFFFYYRFINSEEDRERMILYIDTPKCLLCVCGHKYICVSVFECRYVYITDQYSHSPTQTESHIHADTDNYTCREV